MVVRHDALTNCLAALAKRGMDNKPRLEQVLPQLTTQVAGQVGAGCMDVVISHGSTRYLVDVVIVSPLAGGDRQVLPAPGGMALLAAVQPSPNAPNTITLSLSRSLSKRLAGSGARREPS